MRHVTILAGLALFGGRASAANLWQECQIETVTLCTPDDCKNVEPTLKLYFGDFVGHDGKRAGYYYRCRRDGPCDKIVNPWIGRNDRYRVFVIRESAVISRIDADGKVTDVATLDDHVLISRGTCWSARPEDAPHSDQ